MHDPVAPQDWGRLPQATRSGGSGQRGGEDQHSPNTFRMVGEAARQ